MLPYSEEEELFHNLSQGNLFPWLKIRLPIFQEHVKWAGGHTGSQSHFICLVLRESKGFYESSE